MQTIAGLATARGFAIGPVFIYRGAGDVPVPEYSIEPGVVGDELLRLKRAIVDTGRDIDLMVSTLRERTGGEDVRVFESHRMLLNDPMLIEQAEGAIRNDHINAEAAVRRAFNHGRELFSRMNDEYFRERVRDLDDVGRRLLKSLMGFAGEVHAELKTPSIIVADDLTPSETVQLPQDNVLGFATNGGSTTSHVALLARAMGIPAVSGLGDITSRVKPGEVILLDGTGGSVTLNPDVATARDFRDLVERQREIAEETVMRAPAGTLRDGGDVPLLANVHPGVPVRDIVRQGARGIGLYRSEYLWLNRDREPDEETQFEAYRNAARIVSDLGPGASLTIRALDIGGDKLVKGVSRTETNPFLGNRSIRYLLANRDVFGAQLRAILRASAFGRVALMYPMISCVEELQECSEALAEAKVALDRAGIAYDRELKIGAMIEVPSAALIADALAAKVDFLSIGTNDLVQYAMAADRGNESVAHLYQPTNPAILKLIRMTVDAARSHRIRVSVCGESAADPIVGVLWAAMGVDALSMSASYIPPMSKLLSRLTRSDLDEYLAVVERLGGSVTAADVFETCREWMLSKIPDLDNIVI